MYRVHISQISLSFVLEANLILSKSKTKVQNTVIAVKIIYAIT